MYILKISKNTAENIIRRKHYSKKLGIMWEAFGLYDDDNKIIGVCCYGQPSAPIQKYAFHDRNFRLYELTRLVIDDDTPKNAGSFFISNSLKLLSEKPCAIVSYADSAWGHCGIVYQSANWLYTGATTSHDCLYLVDGEILHPMTIRDRFNVTEIAKWARDNGVTKVKPKEKHRYFYFMGNKFQKREMLSKLKYKVIDEYPKCEKVKYVSAGSCAIP